MSLEKTTKQSSESYLIYGNFGAVMEEGETITAYDVTAIDGNDPAQDATSTVIEPGSEIVGSGDDFAKLYFRVRAGTEDDSPYKITVKVTTSNDNHWEVDGELVIKET